MRRVLVVTALLAWATGGVASPVRWTLTDVLFEDDGTATGSFVYDADTDTYSAIAITITDGTLQPLASVGDLLLGGASDAAFVLDASLANLTGEYLLQLIFQSPLSNDGGAISLVDAFFPAASSFDGACADTACVQFDFSRLMVDGLVVGEPVSEVPLPAASVLFGPAMFGLGVFGRRRQARAR